MLTVQQENWVKSSVEDILKDEEAYQIDGSNKVESVAKIIYEELENFFDDILYSEVKEKVSLLLNKTLKVG